MAGAPTVAAQPIVTAGGVEGGGGGGVAAAAFKIGERVNAIKTPDEIKAQEVHRMAEAKKQAEDLKAKGLDFDKVGKKEAQEIIAELNQKGAALPGGERAETQVQEALDFQRELALANLDIKQRMVQAGESVADEAGIVTKAEAQVLEVRIKAATPKEEVELTPAQQKERDEKKAKDEADVALQVEIAAATADWAKQYIADDQSADIRKALSKQARRLLKTIAARTQSEEMAYRLKVAKEERRAADNHAQAEAADIKVARAEKTKKAADLQLKDVDLKKIEADSTASVEDRLFAFDVDLALDNIQLKDASNKVTEIQATIATAAEGKKPGLELLLEEAQAAEAALVKKIQDLKDARKNIKGPGGEDLTKDVSDVNYVSGMVKILTEGVPDLTEDQIKQMDRDPIGVLNTLMSDPDKMSAIFANSGISQKQQEEIIATAKSESAASKVKAGEKADNAMSFGKLLLMLMALLGYTASATNKSKKGG